MKVRRIIERRRLRWGFVGILVLVAVLLALALSFTVPTIDSIDNRWGTIADETSEIRTEVVVENPNIVPIPPLLTLEYDVRLNSVTIADAEKRGVGFPRGRSTIHLSTGMNNSRIAPWWRTHVEADERTTMTIDPSVSLMVLPVTIDLPAEREPVETDVMASINTETGHPIPLFEAPDVVLETHSANWGKPTDDRTPINVTLTLDNRAESMVTVEDLQYQLVMNNVMVGSGDLDREVVLEEETSRRVRVTAYIENQRMNEWWVTHLRRGEVTQVRVDLSGTVRVRSLGERHTFDVPIHNSTVETEILG